MSWYTKKNIDKISKSKGYILLDKIGIPTEQHEFRCLKKNYHKFSRPLVILYRTRKEVNQGLCPFCTKKKCHIIDAKKRCLELGFQILNESELIKDNYGTIKAGTNVELKSLKCDNHKFSRPWSSIRDPKKPNKCSICANDYRHIGKITFEEYRKFIREVYPGGDVLYNKNKEERWIGSRKRYYHDCGNSAHDNWWSVGESVMKNRIKKIKGHWCGTCAGNKKLDWNKCYERIKKINKNFELQKDTEPEDQYTDLMILHTICGNTFPRSIFNFNKNRLCSYCKPKSISQSICRIILENLLEIGFLENRRPDFMKDKNGVRRELDLYNEKEKIALEFHGNNELYSHTSKELRIIDKEKAKLTKLAGIKLIVVWEPPGILANKGFNSENYMAILKKQIIKQLRKLDIPIKNKNFQVDLNNLNIPAYAEELDNFSIEKNFTVLERPNFLTKMSKFKVRCNVCNFSNWNTSLQQLEAGYNCRKCAKQYLEKPDIENFLKKYKYKFLSNDYKNQDTKYNYKCLMCKKEIKHRVWTSFKRSILLNKSRPCNFPKENPGRDKSNDCKI
jgi:hypothetical protein